MSYDKLINIVFNFEKLAETIIKKSTIRRLKSGKWRVYSQSGKNMGTYNSRDEAEERLKQIEMFKHMD